MKHILQTRKTSSSFISIRALVLALAITGAASRGMAQARTGETVIQRATEQFDSSPLTTTSLGNGLFMFSGDGGGRYGYRR